LRIGEFSVGVMNQVQVFRMSRGWKVFFSVGIPLLAVVFGRLMLEPFLGERTYQSGQAVSLFLFGAIPLSFFVYLFPWVFKVRVEVFPDRIKVIGPRTKELLIDEIEGFRIIPTQYMRTLLLLPNNPKTKKIKIEMVFEKKAVLFDWLNRNLKNLDALNAQEEINRIASDPQLGETREQRLYVLDRAKMWSKILSVLCLAAMFWTIFKPHPYQYAIWTCIILPLLVLGFVRGFHGVLSFEDDRKKSALPNIFAAFLMPGFGLAIRAIADFNILDWAKFWIPFACIFLSFYLLTLLMTRGIRGKVGTAIALILFCAFYGYGAVVCLNGILDKSSPSVYKAQVVGKRVSTGKHTSYNLKLSPWGPRKEEKEVDVAKSVYGKHEIGDYVRVIVRQGRFGIPWFYAL